MWYSSGVDDDGCGILVSTDTSTYWHRNAGYGRPSLRHKGQDVQQHFITPRQHRHLIFMLQMIRDFFSNLWKDPYTEGGIVNFILKKVIQI